jgi:hypothetical protein
MQDPEAHDHPYRQQGIKQKRRPIRVSLEPEQQAVADEDKRERDGGASRANL